MPLAALYDTSVVIDLEKVDQGEYEERTVVVSAITVGELAYGSDAADPAARELRLRRVLTSYEIVPFGVEEAKIYGVLAELVRAAGRNPRPRRLDLQIAATAAAARLPLLTMNPDDFVGVGTTRRRRADLARAEADSRATGPRRNRPRAHVYLRRALPRLPGVRPRGARGGENRRGVGFGHAVARGDMGEPAAAGGGGRAEGC